MAHTLAILASLLLGPAEGPSLRGMVTDEKGKPLPGAMVGLHSARPRRGLPVVCPSCYRDCSKTAKTDEQGIFVIEDLDPELLFRVYALFPGRSSHLTGLIDPATSKAEIKLPLIPTLLPGNQVLKGKVVDDKGKPLVGAVVSPWGAKIGETFHYGALDYLDEGTVTDTEGKFTVVSKKPLVAIDVRVSAGGFATSPSNPFVLDDQDHVIQMQRGANVSGRFLYQGKPLPGRAVGIVQKERGAMSFLGETTQATDANGAFHFSDLKSDEEYVLYTLSDGVQDLPVLKAVDLKTGAGGAVREVGDLNLAKGFVLKGRVEFPKDQVIPANAKLLLSRHRAWDWCEGKLAENGEYHFVGLPPGVYILSVVAPGFQLDPERVMNQMTGPSNIALRLSDKGPGLMDIPLPLIRTEAEKKNQ